MFGIKRVRPAALIAAVASVMMAFGIQAQQYKTVTINCTAYFEFWGDGVIWSDHTAARIDVCHGTPTFANTYRGEEIGYKDVQFPAPPYQLDSISIVAGITATWPKTIVTFFLDKNSFNGGMQFTEGLTCHNGAGTGSFCDLATYSFRMSDDVRALDISGTHNVWSRLDGGGEANEGAGNWATYKFTFVNSGVGIRSQHSSRATSSPAQRVRFVNLTSRATMPAAALYDVHGRRIGGGAGCAAATHGIAIAAGQDLGGGK
jgi:hypothetical protein